MVETDSPDRKDLAITHEKGCVLAANKERLYSDSVHPDTQRWGIFLSAPPFHFWGGKGFN